MRRPGPGPESVRASDGVCLRYRVDDYTDPWLDADTVILLHAAQGCAQRLYGWVPHLAREFRVVRPDARGHGDSDVPPPDAALDIDRLAADVVELIDHVGCRAVHLAGSSAGAMVAMRVASTRPERVSSLACFAATAGMRRSAFDFRSWAKTIEEKGMRGFLSDSLWHRFDLDRTDRRLVEWWLDLAEASNRDIDFAARFVATMAKLDLREDLDRIACPVLCVVPGADPEHPLSEYAVLRDRLAAVEFDVIEGYPHNITDALPDRCALRLREFLRARGP